MIPERRGYHTSFVYNSKLYIYGGTDIREGAFENLWRFELGALEVLNDLGNLSPGAERPNHSWERLETRGTSPGK